MSHATEHTCKLSRFSQESPSFSSNLPVSRLEHQGCLPFVGTSGWCDRCIMVRDFPNSTDKPDEITLTIYLASVLSRSSLETEDSFKW